MKHVPLLTVRRNEGLRMKIFTGENFNAEVLSASMPVVVDFFATWCGPCKMMAPVLEKLDAEYEGKALIGKLDVDENGELAAKYGVMSIPTLIFFKDGQVVSKMVGLQNGNTLKAAIEEMLEK